MSRGDHGGGCHGRGVVSCHPQPPQAPKERPEDISHQGQPAKTQRQGQQCGGAAVSPSTEIQEDMGWWPPPHHQVLLSSSPQFSARLAEHSRQLVGVQNEYGFALAAATAHLEHYRRVELPAAMQVGPAWTPLCPPHGVPQEASPRCCCEGEQQGGSCWCGDRAGGTAGSGMPLGGYGQCQGVLSPPAFPQALDGDLYERLREHLTVASRTEVETCRATQDWFQGVAEASVQVTAPIPRAGGTGGDR